MTASGHSRSGARTAPIARSADSAIRTASDQFARGASRPGERDGTLALISPGDQRAVAPMPRTSAHPSRPAAGRLSGTTIQGVSFLPAATSAANSAAALTNEPSAAAAFWVGVARGTEKLTTTEDQMIWDLRAAHWRWDYIARAILERRSKIRRRLAKGSAVLARAKYRRERGLA